MREGGQLRSFFPSDWLLQYPLLFSVSMCNFHNKSLKMENVSFHSPEENSVKMLAFYSQSMDTKLALAAYL